MRPTVTFVSGLRRSGKSALIHLMIDRFWKNEPHYIRLVKTGSNKHRPKASVLEPPCQCGVASARWLEYDNEHIFDVLPAALAAIHEQDHCATVVIEADSDSTLRHAYPYDYRVFVMPLPTDTTIVFRDSHRAASELQRVLDDTSTFASEFFGIVLESPQEEVDPSETRPDLTETQMRGFLYSPLGDELATRVQLQQPYHGLVESDVIVVNTSLGERSSKTDTCLRRIERMLARIRGLSHRQNELFLCNLQDHGGRALKKLRKALAPMGQERL